MPRLRTANIALASLNSVVSVAWLVAAEAGKSTHCRELAMVWASALEDAIAIHPSNVLVVVPALAILASAMIARTTRLTVPAFVAGVALLVVSIAFGFDAHWPTCQQWGEEPHIFWVGWNFAVLAFYAFYIAGAAILYRLGEPR